MIRRTALVLSAAAAIVIGAGCGARTSDIPGTYTEGGFGTPFFAEVPLVQEGMKPKILLFGKIADYEEYLEKRETPEVRVTYIAKGANRETIFVKPLKGMDAKDNPDYAAKLLAKYQKRHGLSSAPAAE